MAARVKPTGDKYLCAYIAANTVPPPNTSDLREYLSQHFPGYMIPSYFVSMEKIPLTLNGKVDRKALPDPDASLYRPALANTYVEPQTNNEKVIAQLWKEVLQVEKVGTHDNFFDLGGNSLHVIQLGEKIKETFGINIPVVEMFRNLTVDFLEEYLDKKGIDGDTGKEEKVKRTRALNKAMATFQDTIKKFER